MDWPEIFASMGADRLARLASSAGIRRATQAKKTLIKALMQHLDDALKAEALMLLSVERLRELAKKARPHTGAARKHDLIHVLLSTDRDDDEQELSELDFLVPDRGRHDLPEGGRSESPMEVLPSRPTGQLDDADVTLALEVQQLLRRPGLKRAVFVAPTSEASILGRLLTDELDDLVESAARLGSGRHDRAALTFILDGTDHGLGDSPTGRALTALATELRGVVEVRLTDAHHRLRAQLLTFEEERPDGVFLTAIVGGGGALGDGEVGPAIEAHFRMAGSVASQAVPCSLAKEWVAQLLRDARSLTPAQLEGLSPDPAVLRKVAYKRDFDTAHELALKHLAEHVCRRGRWSPPLFDASAVHPPPPHQQLAVCLASRPYQHGALLLDDAGLGKTIEVGLILARELRRRRVHAASDTTERRRALVVAPTSLVPHWREELTAKLGLDVVVFDAREPPELRARAQVLVCGPPALRRSWEELQGADVLVVDEAMLFGDETLAILRKLRESAELCLVTSSVPAVDEPGDLLALAELACPKDGFGALVDLLGEEASMQQIGEEIREITARARTREVAPKKHGQERTLLERSYDLDEVDLGAYLAVRSLRHDFLERGDHEHTGAFTSLERAFLSSHQAFAAALYGLLSDDVSDSVLFVGAAADASYAFFRQSGYFKRRLRTVRDGLGGRLSPGAELSAKEAAMLAVLAECKREPVVILTQYRATAGRIVTVLERARISAVELVDEASAVRERAGVVARFCERCAQNNVADGPTGVIVCTDAAAEQLGLDQAGHVLVNYDLPWDPHIIERRITRLARWGQSQAVRVYNLVASHPEQTMRTMDSRIVYACTELFSMGEGRASLALLEVEPEVLTARLTDEDAPELSLIEEPDPEAIAEVDAWLGDDQRAALLRERDRAIEDDMRRRADLLDLWARVSHHRGTLAGARGHLFGRMRQALLQGMVGVLCAPERSIAECEDWHLVVGLRLLVESAAVEAGVEPWLDAPDDNWLVEDEVVHLWAVSPSGQLTDWAEFLMGDRLTEVVERDARRIVDRAVLEFLVAEKLSLERRGLDAVPLAGWLGSAPPALEERLLVVSEHAQAMAEARHAEIEAAWAEAKDERLVRLDARRHLVEDHPAAKAATEAALACAHAEDVTIRHTVLGTQLFIVTH